METAWKAGLEDVIAARSGICQVDGERGRLYYRGYEVGELAGALSFEDVTALLWHGELPSAAESARFASRLQAARGLPPAVADLLQTLPRDAHPLDALRTAVSLAATRDPDARSNEPAANLAKAFRLMTLVPETVAAWQRIRTGRAPVTTAAATSHAAYFLELLEGRAPSREVAHDLAGERRLLLGRGLRRARDPAGLLHVDLRGGAGRGLVRPRAGTVRRQPAHPAARRLHRLRAAAARGRSATEDGDLHRVVVEVIAATIVATAGPDVLEIGRHLAARDARVVGDDHRAGHELRLELSEVVEIVFFLGVDEGEVEAAGQQRDHPQRIAGDHFHPLSQPGLGDVRADQVRQERVRLDARQPSARRHRAGDQDRRVAEQGPELDRARGPVAVEQPAQHASLGPPHVQDVPGGGGAVHQRQHPARLLRHARAAGTRPATLSGTG